MISLQDYQARYQQALDDPDPFWALQARQLHWSKPFTRVKETSFDKDDFHIQWFADGELNASYNCLDRHLDQYRDKLALIWEGNEPDQQRRLTYGQLHEDVCKLAHVFQQLNVTKGDRVIIYMPLVPEAIIAMLACTRIGAVHSVVFGGFSAESLANRIDDCQAKLVITALEGKRGPKTIAFKEIVDQSLVLSQTQSVEHVIVVHDQPLTLTAPTLSYDQLMAQASPDTPAHPMNAEDPLFILYTSGSTGKPKGVLHTTGGYLTYAALTFQTIFDYGHDDVYWSTADVGWITGHTYTVYGPLLNAATLVIYEGIPSYPTHARFWEMIDRHQVNIFYTAPTALRALMKEGDAYVLANRLDSLRILGSVGEPLNEAAWNWYRTVVGKNRCPIMDTWWQTETGGILMAPFVKDTEKPGFVGLPFFGVQPALITEQGELDGPGTGDLVLKTAWPGMARTIYGDHPRFLKTYFEMYPGCYLTGDQAHRDETGRYQITGRIDDVINVAGHRLGTAELESALALHPAVAETAVVGCPHPIKGQGIYAFVILKEGIITNDKLKQTLTQWLRQKIGAIATLDFLQWAPGLPKTRSGKIMRRILRKIAANDLKDMGDLSTLADPTIFDILVRDRLITHPEEKS